MTDREHEQVLAREERSARESKMMFWQGLLLGSVGTLIGVALARVVLFAVG